MYRNMQWLKDKETKYINPTRKKYIVHNKNLQVKSSYY